jgi:hypothetical protein
MARTHPAVDRATSLGSGNGSDLPTLKLGGAFSTDRFLLPL